MPWALERGGNVWTQLSQVAQAFRCPDEPLHLSALRKTVLTVLKAGSPRPPEEARTVEDCQDEDT